MDISNLISDLVNVLSDLKKLATDLEALGIDVKALFTAAAQGDHAAVKAILEPHGPKLGAVNWDKLLQLLVTYGPTLYAILAAMFGWPVPNPTPAT